MTITPGQYDIVIYQGATFSQLFTWRDSNNALVNLTGFTARMMARSSADSPTAFLTLTTENGGIALGGTAGTLMLSRSPAQTAALPATSGVYDLEVVDGAGQVHRLLQGNLMVSAEVTR